MSEQTTILPEISYDEFAKVDIRVGKVLNAHRVVKSEKLIHLHVSFGSFERNILSGVGKTYSPEDLMDKEFLFVINLAPRKLMGIESHGMMLATGESPNALSLITHSQSGTSFAGFRVG